MSTISTAIACLALGHVLGTAALETATTVVSGIVREAVSGKALSGAEIAIDGNVATSDANGSFALRVSRSSTSLMMRRAGYLEFQYPILRLRGDTVAVEIELRSNPPTAAMYTSPGFLPFICVFDDGDRLRVLHGCSSPRREEYSKRIIKHNPWSLYFGEAADRSGVLLAIRIRNP